MTYDSQQQTAILISLQCSKTAALGVVLGIAFFGLFFPVSARAAVFTVNSPADVGDARPGDGFCETTSGNGVCTLRAAIQEANTLAGADQISLPPNIYTLTLADPLDVTGNITITGSGAVITIIDGNKAMRFSGGILHINSGVTASISGVTLRHGRRSSFGPDLGAGGGIHNAGNLALSNAVVIGNEADSGGGIYNFGALTISNSMVSANTGKSNGGGIRNDGALLLSNSTVSGNNAGPGGGIFNLGATTILNSTISGNSASSGGGVFNNGNIKFINSTVSGNGSRADGGGIYNRQQVALQNSVMVFSSTIANNRAGDDPNGMGTGGGVFNEGDAIFQFQNTILARNRETAFINRLWISTDGDCAGTIQSNGNNIVTAAHCTIIGPFISTDPQLGPLANNGGPTQTHALSVGSPAIDAGNPGGCRDDRGALLLTDQRGFPRPSDFAADRNCDMGAYELQTGSTTVIAAILPSSRSVQVDTVTTVFATIINVGQTLATDCSVKPLTSIPAFFQYQTSDPATNQVTGSPNTPANIAAGALQSFVLAFIPTAPFAPTDVQFSFDCATSNPAPVNSGLNTLLLSASATPVPDIVALAATTTKDGIVNITGTNGAGAFAVATVNVGATASITASADAGSALLPVNIFLCQTNPGTGQCISTIGPIVTTTINAGATRTFGIFVQGNGIVPFDPATNRIFVRFRDGSGVIRGSTSVAVRTQ